jgi:hypothetical protein
MSIPFFPAEEQEVMIVLQDVAQGRAVPCAVHRADPFTLKIRKPVPRLPKGARLIVLYLVEGVHHMLNCQVIEETVRDEATYAELRITAHENLERRRSSRRRVNLSGELAFVDGPAETPEITHRPARVTDLSTHGAWVETELEVNVGGLFNLAIPMPGLPTIRVLGLCSRRDAGRGMALEFVNFVGSSQQVLEEYLAGIGEAA